MNASQMDPIASPTSNRIVGWASGAYLEAKLAEGYLCGPWSPSRKAYAVMRKPKKRGVKSKLSGELECEALSLYAEIHLCRKRLDEIARETGISKLMQRLAYLRSHREST